MISSRILSVFYDFALSHSSSFFLIVRPLLVYHREQVSCFVPFALFLQLTNMSSSITGGSDDLVIVFGWAVIIKYDTAL